MTTNQNPALLTSKEIMGVVRGVQHQAKNNVSVLAHAVVSAAVHAHLFCDVTLGRNVLEAIPARSPKRKQVREWLLKFAPVAFDPSGAMVFHRPYNAKDAEARAEAIERCQQAAHLIFGGKDSHAGDTQKAGTSDDRSIPKDSRRFDLKDELAKLITRAERAKLGTLTTGVVSVDDHLLNKLKAACPVSWDKP